MFTIRSQSLLEEAYCLLREIEKRKQAGRRDLDQYEIHIKEEIRRYNKAQQEGIIGTIIKDYGIDGYVSLEKLPDQLNGSDIDDVNEWFEEHRAYPEIRSAYDCTGRPFTNWFKCFRRRGHWMAYHSVGYDC